MTQELIVPIRRWLVDHFPDSIRGWYDYYRHPELLDSFGGAFNGQCFRQLIYLELALACNFEAIVETGTFRGSTSIFLAQNSGGAQVYSCESSGRYFEFAKRRLRGIQNLSLFKLDSREFIQRLDIPRQARTFFYWEESLPLQEELDLII